MDGVFSGVLMVSLGCLAIKCVNMFEVPPVYVNSKEHRVHFTILPSNSLLKNLHACDVVGGGILNDNKFRDFRTLGTVDNVNCTQVKFHECKKVRMSEERWPVRPLTRYLNSN